MSCDVTKHLIYLVSEIFAKKNVLPSRMEVKTCLTKNNNIVIWIHVNMQMLMKILVFTIFLLTFLKPMWNQHEYKM